MPEQFLAISGATHGIGRATAELFARRGWSVAVAARSEADLAAMRTYWHEHFPGRQLLTVAADLGTQDGCHRFTHRIRDRWPYLNLLVNNLGVFAPGSLLEGPEDQLETFLSANLLSAHRLTRGLGAQLRAAARAHVITIGSVAALDWPGHMPAYAIAKHALHGWHRCLRAELRHTAVRASLLVPGATYTRSWQGVEVDPSTLLAPETVANAIARLWDDNQDRDTDQLIIRPPHE